MAEADDFWGASFGGFEDESDLNASANARADRIAAARQAAMLYQAKIEEPMWFMRTETAPMTTKPGAHRPDQFVVHSLYLSGDYKAALKNGLDLLKRDRARKKVGSEDVELMDIILRSALKLSLFDNEQVIAVAKRYKDLRTIPTYAMTAARVLLAAPPSAQPDPLDPLEAILVALAFQPSLPPYLELLSQILASLDPLLNRVLQSQSLAQQSEQDRAAVQEQVAKLGLSDSGRKTLEKVLGLHGQVNNEEETDLPRNVRSL